MFCPLLDADCREEWCSWWVPEDQETPGAVGPTACVLFAIFEGIKAVDETLNELEYQIAGDNYAGKDDPGLLFEILRKIEN